MMAPLVSNCSVYWSRVEKKIRISPSWFLVVFLTRGMIFGSDMDPVGGKKCNLISLGCEPLVSAQSGECAQPSAVRKKKPYHV